MEPEINWQSVMSLCLPFGRNQLSRNHSPKQKLSKKKFCFFPFYDFLLFFLLNKVLSFDCFILIRMKNCRRSLIFIFKLSPVLKQFCEVKSMVPRFQIPGGQKNGSILSPGPNVNVKPHFSVLIKCWKIQKLHPCCVSSRQEETETWIPCLRKSCRQEFLMSGC